jgi:anti-sigma-K factor RskA
VLVRQGDHYEIRLTDTELPALADDDLELWLIEPDAAGAPLDVAPVAVVDRAGSGSYRVPSNLDPASHYIVDISIEPRDGDAAHSGRSILRGALQPSA